MPTTHVNSRREEIISANLEQLSDSSYTLPWITPSQAVEAEAQRARLLAHLEPFITSVFKQTKPYFKDLSPGCRICGLGEWSCLFINGKCNCRCFYCPTVQDDIGVPTTNQIPFAKAADYTEYIKRFGFSGVSISGGEPLLTFDRAVHYIETVRHACGEELHIWMYTNGTLVTKDRLKTLKDAGLDEIRFDISAADYDLKKVQMAAGIIPHITVEIPAIPEDFDRMSNLLPAMVETGVRYLNLHQLRMTPHNSAHLRMRNYTFLHGENITILESELTALNFLKIAAEKNMKLPINYCSFVYKRRYQQAANRRRHAIRIIKGYESITENGFIRSMSLAGPPEILDRQARELARLNVDPQLWTTNTKKDRLHFHETLWSRMDIRNCLLKLTYSEAVLCPYISYRCAFKEVRLESGRKIYIERRPIRVELTLDGMDCDFFETTALKGSPSGKPTLTPLQEEILQYEFIQPGLQDYF